MAKKVGPWPSEPVSTRVLQARTIDQSLASIFHQGQEAVASDQKSGSMAAIFTFLPSSIERLTYRGDHLWWSLFVRLANPEARREAITSRPWLMSSVGRRTEHAGQTTITLTGLHAHFEKARAALMRVSAMLQGWVARAAEQLDPTTVWHLVCEHLKRLLAGVGPPPAHRLLDNHANGIG